jgi:hypothetical protein
MEDALDDAESARAMRRRELALLESLGGNPHHEALARAHLAQLARRSGDRALAGREAARARALARRSTVPGHATRIEAALAAERWSDDPR